MLGAASLVINLVVAMLGAAASFITSPATAMLGAASLVASPATAAAPLSLVTIGLTVAVCVMNYDPLPATQDDLDPGTDAEAFEPGTDAKDIDPGTDEPYGRFDALHAIPSGHVKQPDSRFFTLRGPATLAKHLYDFIFGARHERYADMDTAAVNVLTKENEELAKPVIRPLVDAMAKLMGGKLRAAKLRTSGAEFSEEGNEMPQGPPPKKRRKRNKECKERKGQDAQEASAREGKGDIAWKAANAAKAAKRAAKETLGEWVKRSSNHCDSWRRVSPLANPSRSRIHFWFFHLTYAYMHVTVG
jgi:hypothetical protein